MKKNSIAQRENEMAATLQTIQDTKRAIAEVMLRKGRGHPLVARKFLELSILLNRLGQHERAMTCAGRAVEVYTRAYGVDDRRVEESLRVFTAAMVLTGLPERMVSMAQ